MSLVSTTKIFSPIRKLILFIYSTLIIRSTNRHRKNVFSVLYDTAKKNALFYI